MLNSRDKMSDRSELYNYFSYIWLINQCFCLSNRTAQSSSNKTLTIVIRRLYNTIVGIIAIICVYYKLEKTTIQRNMKILPQYTDILMFTSILLGAIVAVMVNLFHQQKLQVILTQIDNLERKMKVYGITISYKRDKRYILVLLYLTGFYWIAHTIYYNFYADATTDISHWAFTYIPFIVISIYTIQFFAFCLIIRTLYCTFNHFLLNYTTTTLQKEMFNQIQLFHNKLYKVVTAVNDVHSIPILIILAANFIFMFGCSYLCLFGYMNKTRYVKPEKFSDYLVPIIPTIPVLLQFFLIIGASEYVSKQRLETAKTIHNFSVNNNSLSQWVCTFINITILRVLLTFCFY